MPPSRAAPLGNGPDELHADRVYLEVTRDADGPGKLASREPLAKRRAQPVTGVRQHTAEAHTDATPVETELLVQADRLVGGSDAVLVIDDTAIPKKGKHSVGVAAQYASALGKTANCQTLVSLTLARGEVPGMLALRLFLPDSWA